MKRLIKLGLVATCGMVIGIVSLNIIPLTIGFFSTANIDKENADQYDGVPILVLGAGIVDSENPSGILALRLDKALELSQLLPTSPLIMSGDHQDQYYNEVSVMKGYLVGKGVDSNRIYQDHLGLSTYQSLARYKLFSNQSKVIIVTQGYHLARALMLGQGLGLDAIGVAAQDNQSTRLQREWREVFARIKDVFVTYFGINNQTYSQEQAYNLEQPGDTTD